jgi:hypothetical protein
MPPYPKTRSKLHANSNGSRTIEPPGGIEDSSDPH